MRERSGAARRFGYQPALDGVRAIAVAAVLFFHGGFGWMSGGYVGVSVFFTLSGFLITSLALVEHDRTGRLDVGAFYARRVRRLLPASLACIGGVIVLAWTGVFDEVASLRRDVWAALAQIYNWVSLASGDSYAEVVSGNTGRISPLDHYWSLAIEEQFYWVWPLALLVVLRFAPKGRALLLGAATVGFAAAAPITAAVWGGNAAYYATPARLAELLVGAVATLALHSWRGAGRHLPRGTHLLAPAGLLVIAWAAVTWPAGSGPAYAGWFPAFAVASAALVVGLQVDGPVRRLLATSPLVALGAISYGVYLYHWPVFAVLDQERLAMGRGPLFVLRVAVTLALAIASAILLERPVRRARRTIRPVSRLAAGACVALAAVVVLVPFHNAAYWNGSETARDAVALETVDSVAELQALTPSTTSAAATYTTPPGAAPATVVAPTDETPPTTATTATTMTTAPSARLPTAVEAAGAPVPTLPASMSRPARILVFGDSTASAMGEGLVQWAGAHPDLAQVTIRWAPGCGFVTVGAQEFDVPSYRAACEDVRTDLPDVLASLQPDVVVLMVTIGDTEARALSAGGELLRPGDPRFTELIDEGYDRILAELEAAGVDRVAWIVPPTPDTEHHELAPNLDNPARWSTLRAAVERMAALRPDVVTAVDLAAWEAAQPVPGRPDGLHFSVEGATRLADTMLAPTLLDLALR